MNENAESGLVGVCWLENWGFVWYDRIGVLATSEIEWLTLQIYTPSVEVQAIVKLFRAAHQPPANHSPSQV
jgi:hypothetical protein